MANTTSSADREWLWHMQEDIQRQINMKRMMNMERMMKRKRRGRRPPQPSYPSAKALYHKALEDS